MELMTVTGKQLYRDSLPETKYPCSLTINEFINQIEKEFNGNVVDFTLTDGYVGIADTHEINFGETLQELYIKNGKNDEIIFEITINTSNNAPKVSIGNISKLKKTVKNAKNALNAEKRNGNSRKALNAASKAHSEASKALLNAQNPNRKRYGGRKSSRKTRRNRK